jgi:hypothetical protein
MIETGARQVADAVVAGRCKAAHAHIPIEISGVPADNGWRDTGVA